MHAPTPDGFLVTTAVPLRRSYLSPELTSNPEAPAPGGGPDVTRLRHQREEADRAYNDALTALDRAVRELREFPAAPPAFDDTQVPRLNERWQLLSASSGEADGWRGRLRRYILAAVAPLFQRQQ